MKGRGLPWVQLLSEAASKEASWAHACQAAELGKGNITTSDPSDGLGGGGRCEGVAYTPSHSPVMGSGYCKVCKQMVFASTMPREGLRQKCQPNRVPTAGAECPSMRDPCCPLQQGWPSGGDLGQHLCHAGSVHLSFFTQADARQWWCSRPASTACEEDINKAL